jgi:hypothetical protein
MNHSKKRIYISKSTYYAAKRRKKILKSAGENEKSGENLSENRTSHVSTIELAIDIIPALPMPKKEQKNIHWFRN